MEAAIVDVRAWSKIDCKLVGYGVSAGGCKEAGALIIVGQGWATRRRKGWHVFVHVDNETVRHAVTA